ncbi:UDP-sugar transporter UST74c isoform X2 [Culicoides brevitarsis]|uniref:UDP-sugar transporter UST74c isoform X2 n=1 Tax=Culicoides brevitarsis TaxID=469753 RepID=UPI00307CA12B
MADPGSATQFMKIGSALFYGFSSFMITVVNKTVLTTYKFPSFLVLSLGQLFASVIVLSFGKQMKFISYPSFHLDIPKKIFPLPLIFLGNMMFGLGGTQALSLPMFAALRRFSILMTMLLEMKLLQIRPSFAVQISVYSMIGGALLAATANGVFVKKKLETVDLGRYGLMFYNSLFMLVPALLGTWIAGDLQLGIEFSYWNDPVFVVQFILSCIMGFILTYSTILCTQYNSALTTTIVGCLKNISITYIGMFIGGDYVFSWLNCIGINISVMGSLLYTYVTFRRKQIKQVQKSDDQMHLLNSSKTETV